MPSIRQSIRSSTASKRPTSAIADGQIALNTASSTPGMFFKDSAGNIVKAGPAHYGATAPNSSPAVGGSTGNSFGEAWLDVSLTPAGWKIWNGSAWVNATPLSSDTVQGLVELATNAETQAGVDAARAVTAASLQSKVSDSISTTSAFGIASSTAVKTAYDLANAALPKSGGIVTGNLEIGSTGSFTFEGATADGFETTLAVVDPTADRTITFPNITGTVVTTGDTGTVTSTMILDGTILDADINASAAIVDTKLATIATALKVSNSATTATDANTPSAIVARSASGNFTAGTITAALTGAASSNVLKAGDTMTGVLAVTAGTAALPGIAVSGDLDSGLFSPGANQVAISTNGTGKLFVDSTGNIGVLAASPSAWSYGGNIAIPGGGRYIASTSDDIRFASNLYYSDVERYSANGFAAKYRIADGTHQWSIAATGTAGNAITLNEAMRIDSSGRLGLGTSSPSQLLEVENSSGNVAINITSSDAGYAELYFGDQSNASACALSYEHSSNKLRFYNGGSARVTLDSSGNVGIGTSSPGYSLDVQGNIGATIASKTASFDAVGASIYASFNDGTKTWRAGAGIISAGLFTIRNNTDAINPVNITSAGLVGIGTTSPVSELDVNGRISAIAGTSGAPSFNCRTDTNTGINLPEGDRIQFIVGGNEAARIDASSRLLVGTPTARTSASHTGSIQLEGTSFSTATASIITNANDSTGAYLHLGKARGGSIGNTTVVQSGDTLGQIHFTGSDGTNLINGAFVSAVVDGTPGANDMPGRLVFSTTLDGAASPTERMRITNGGNIFLAAQAGTTAYPGEGNTSNGWMVEGPNGKTFISTASLPSLSLNRNVDDGVIVSIRQAGTEEGTISVSGTTVSYNGAHLSRWSQLPGGATREEILRGTVLSNLDEMCSWGDEDNEQLNRMKVSDVEGDKNVSGVFQAWDDDDDTYTDDFYCAMTGDFIIRIAEGVTVERGDLLMSAGDGTAKPQDDDIIRSKTIAKITSTHVTCTYEDGSYCVPCVLMAC